MEWGPIFRASTTKPFWRVFGGTLWIGFWLAFGALSIAATAIGAVQWIQAKNAPGADVAKAVQGIWDSIDWQTWGRAAPVMFAVCVSAYAAYQVSVATVAKAATIQILVRNQAHFRRLSSGRNSLVLPVTFSFGGLVRVPDVVITNQSDTREARLEFELILLDEQEGSYSAPPVGPLEVRPNHDGSITLQWDATFNRREREDEKADRDVRIAILVRDRLDRNGKRARIACPGEGRV